MMTRSVIAGPWLKAGLSVLLLENASRVAELRGENASAEPSPAAPRAAAPSRMPAAGASQGSAYRAPYGVPSAQPSPQLSPAPAPTIRTAPRKEERPAAQAPSTPTSALLATPGARPVEEWPASWLALKNRRPLPPRPLVLWTYAGLGEDLTGTPDETRRQVIVRMLMELRHPGGTHVFWPCGLQGEQPGDGPDLFWSGVKLLNPRVLLLFGSDARDVLSMPKTLLPFCQERVNGRLVIQLPRPQSLAADEASFRRAQAFLARLLSFCARRQA